MAYQNPNHLLYGKCTEKDTEITAQIQMMLKKIV